MKFSTKEDINAPIEAVFDMLCDFENFERAAIRRGAEVQRVDQLPKPATGITWRAAFDLRGKRREMQLEMVAFDRPQEMVLESTSPGLMGVMAIELMPLSRNRTRVAIVLDIKPLNLSARLLVQSMKLAKTSLTRKFKLRIADYAKTLEERHGRLA
ncbi:SRPBCC family protein [Sulfitobacter aestuarii]|uniref:SRPBCC family protein n=1 Tax=Sulfitobacter aestuarii TaxID=2161676 RepID=A0ABW5TZ01_9RHOB